MPGENDCLGDYYCSVGGLCTKACEGEADCRARCDDVEEDCPLGGDEETWSCVNEVCVCDGEQCPEVSCTGGFCQTPCDGSPFCAPDPYEPRSEE